MRIPTNFVAGNQIYLDMKKILTWWSVLGMGLLYVTLVLASSFIGFLHPICWAFYTVLAALFAVGPYHWLAARWQKFGVGTFLGLLVCILCMATGEATGFWSRAMFVLGGLVADIVRQLMGNENRKTLYWAYPFLVLGNLGWVIRLWTTPQWYVDGALEEMGQAYANGIAKLQTPGHLVAVIVLTVAIAILAIWLCSKVDKKSANLLKYDAQ